MTPTQVLLLSTLVGVLGDELTGRSFRFPTNDFGQKHGSVDGYKSESQLSPLVLHANGGQSHFILTESPDVHHPFGEPNAKGFSHGFILQQQYSSPVRQESEFHDTMPPPLRGAPSRPLPNGFRQKVVPHTYNRHVERHRFGPQKFHQHPTHYPYPTKVLYSPKPNLKDEKSQLSDAIYKFAGFHQQDQTKQLKKPQPDFPEGLGQSDFDGFGNHEYPAVKANLDYLYKQFSDQKYHKPQTQFPKGSFGDYEDFFQVAQKQHSNSEGTRFSDEKYSPKHEHHYTHQDGGNKYPAVKHQMREQFQDSPVNTGQYSVLDKSKYHSSAFKMGNPFDNVETITGNRYEGGPPSHAQQYPSLGQFASLEKSGSEWTPINAPLGAVPARSYDIPSPDLSRGQQRPERFFYNGRVVDEPLRDRYHHHHHKNGNSEEVVSAVVMVKQ